MRKIVPSLIVAALLLGMALPAQATDLHNVLSDYSVTSWSKKDGLPSGTIWALAQDADGYLWIGADFGLIRFDGVRFVAWEALGHSRLPEVSVQVLAVSKDGSLWAGYGGRGGVSRLRNGDVRTFDVSDGLAEGSVTSLVEDASGVMWAVAGGDLFRLVGERWQPSNASGGPAAGSMLTASIGRSGDLLLVSRFGIYRQRHGNTTLERLEASDSLVQGVAEDASGQVWATDRFVGFRQVGRGQSKTQAFENGKGIRLLIDHRGNLWVSTFGQGVWRVRTEGPSSRTAIDHATALTGLSNNVTYSLLEDREGNIWVGTTDGLNRLTAHKVTQMTDLGLVTGLEAGPDGSVWAATADGVLHLSQMGGEWKPTQTFFHGLGTRSIYTDEKGTLWIATDRGLWRLPASGTSGSPTLVTAALRRIVGITSDTNGGVWLTDLDEGIRRWNNGRIDAVNLPPEFQHLRAGPSYTDRDGRVWLGFSTGLLAAVNRDGTIASYGPREGLDAGTCRVIYGDRTGAIWVVGSTGVARFVDGRFVSLPQTHGFPANLTGMLEDDAGALWFGSASGIVRMNRSEFDAAIAGRWEQVNYRAYDTADGVAGTAGWIGLPSAVRTKDGRLWFLTVQGISIIDPRALHADPTAAPVRIDNVVVNDRRIDATTGVSLQPGVTRLAIDYAVPDLTTPLRTRFRYRLDGFDTDWVDGGTRRQVIYTNLPPRSYQFRLQAATQDGGWTRPAAIWDFSVRPAFYQTIWFYTLCVFGLAAGVWGAWRLRLAQIRQQFTLLLGERVRLSREIHDTLLQSLVGVTLQLDQIANDIDGPPETTRDQFVRMRKQVEEYIREARQSIWNLRSSILERCDLPTALRQTGERAADNAVAFDFSVTGDTRRCASVVEEQVLRIGQEAVTNAIRHAQAHRIRMELSYGDADVTLRVSDDGRGFDAATAGDKGTDHWGVMSMKERAETVGGVFRISSGDGEGTLIETVVPLSSHG